MNVLRNLCLLSLWLPLVAGSLPPRPGSATRELAEPEEIRLALEAAPAHLRADAGVHVLGPDGFRQARPSRNGFNCLVLRELPGAFEPQCFDAEGSATLLHVALFRAARQARGLPVAAVEREVAARYERGEFLAPRHTGICYMLSAHNVVVVDRATRQVQRVGPRLLIYAPHIGGAELGATPDLEARLLVADEFTAGAMIVVPVTSARRTRAHYFSPENSGPLTRVREAALAETDRRHGLGDF